MPRLRITTGLSLIALAIGVLGTLWLSMRSDQWDGPRHPVVRTHTAPPAPAYRQISRRHPPPRVIGAARALRVSAPSPASSVAPSLVPISMPPLQSRYDTVRNHLDGSLVLAITVGADGGVLASRVARSSGDAVLDAYARRLVSGWHFAVPPERPAPFSGELPMHFGMADPVARLP